MMCSNWAIAFLLLFAAPGGVGAEEIPLVPERWELAGDAGFVEHEGRRALRLGAGRAMLRDSNFSTGAVEYDVLVNGERGFAGLVFRAQDAGNYENFYIRPHQSGNPDANQYQPVVNGTASWQIFTGEEFGAPNRYRNGEWMRVRLDIYGDSTLVSFDGKPALHIPDLKREEAAGQLGFSASFAGALFSNLKITRIAGYADPRPTAPATPLPSDIVGVWTVSEALAEDEALRRASHGDWAGLAWTSISTETNGIANLARAARRSDDRPAAIARFALSAPEAADVAMRFGFSDRVSIFVNGRKLYRGDDSYTSRDYRFLGSVGFFDTLFLPLRAGLNEVAFVVTEDFGGWAAAARIDPDFSSIEPALSP